LVQIDALRVLSCFSVVAVHTFAAPYPPESVGQGSVTFLLHYSREIFLFVSALVLVRTYYPRMGENGRLADESGFRLRRLRMIGVPYLWWTTIYYAISVFHDRATTPVGAAAGDMPLHWVYLVVTGNGSYHMYFMLVTLQYAVAFPLVLRLLRATRGYHGWVLLASLVAQAAVLYCYQWVFLPPEGWRALIGDASLPAYQFWLVAGAVVGLHLRRCHQWVMRYRWWLVAVVPAAAAVLLWTYFVELPGRGALGASSPLQPVMIMWSLVVLAVLYLVSVWLMSRGPAGVRGSFSYLAQLSFGVYLAHPMVLDLVLALLQHVGLLAPQVWVSVVTFALTSALTIALCSALHRTRFSLALMGRQRGGRPQRVPSASAVRPTPIRRRFAAVPSLALATSALAVLLVGSDQSAASENGPPGWVEIVEASQASPRPDPPAAQASDDEEFGYGSVPTSGKNCPLTDDSPPDPGIHRAGWRCTGATPNRPTGEGLALSASPASP
jgi:peptidoglycan/LPS O-acetylase OafA/YrhL